MLSAIIENLDLEKPSFRPSKWPQKLKPAKNSKLSKLLESCFEPVGKGRRPPIWVTIPYEQDLMKKIYQGILMQENLGALAILHHPKTFSGKYYFYFKFVKFLIHRIVFQYFHCHTLIPQDQMLNFGYVLEDVFAYTPNFKSRN